MRLLIVEDNPYLARTLYATLSPHFAVEVATTGEHALQEIDSRHYDLMMLDLGLPDISGLEVCQALRRQQFKLPILALTASDAILDKVAMLDAGADDYLTKPFEPSELLARLRALLRRGPAQLVPAVLRYRELTVDIASRKVNYAGEPVALRRREYDLLEHLLRNRGMVLTRSMIYEHVWGTENELWSNVVDAQIRSLRNKIDRRYGVKVIKTIYGVGYTIEGKS